MLPIIIIIIIIIIINFLHTEVDMFVVFSHVTYYWPSSSSY
jgi:hypothetical protein